MDTRPPAPVAEHLSEPLWRYWKPTNLDHYYRINRDDFGAAVFGYSLEGTEGRIFRQQYAGTVPIYRYWNHGAGDHFYTTNWNELGGGAWGYVYEGIEGYIFPVRYADTVPLYRYWSASAGDHYYTLEHHPQGFCYGHCWSFEGAIGYVFP